MIAKLSLGVLMVAGLIGAFAYSGEGHDHAAKDVTVSGTISCGKCSLHKAGLTECQDVLSVAGEDGKTTEYYLVKNDVMEKFGHGCKGEKAATVAGTVSEKDGKMWLTAKKVEASTKG